MAGEASVPAALLLAVLAPFVSSDLLRVASEFALAEPVEAADPALLHSQDPEQDLLLEPADAVDLER